MQLKATGVVEAEITAQSMARLMNEVEKAKIILSANTFTQVGCRPTSAATLQPCCVFENVVATLQSSVQASACNCQSVGV